MSADRLRPLTNDAWGFPSNCFVCEPRNDAGLRIRFHHDTVDEVVVADFVLDERFSGAPRFVHGGVVLAVLDEAMAWATIALARRFGVTVETTTRFERPVKIGRRHTVRAWVDAIDGRSMRTAAEVVRDDGKRCADASAVFTALDVDQAATAAGTTLSDEAGRYVWTDRPPRSD